MDRKPILLSKNHCAMIWIYDRHDELFDCVSGAYEPYSNSDVEISKEAAREFVRQMKGSWNGIFMKELKKEIDRQLKKY